MELNLLEKLIFLLFDFFINNEEKKITLLIILIYLNS